MSAPPVFTILVLMLCGCVSQSQHEVSFTSTPATQAASSMRPLSSGETVRIATTFQGERTVRDFTIDSQGNVSIPAFGIIHVEGLTAEEAGKKLEANYWALPPMHRHVRFEVSRF